MASKEAKTCTIDNLVLSSSFIHPPEVRNLTNLQNDNLHDLKILLDNLISANESSIYLLSENTPTGDCYGYYCLSYKSFTKNVRRLSHEGEALLASLTLKMSAS